MLRAAEQERSDVARARRRWRRWQRYLDPQAFVFLDETNINTKMARRYGWAPRGVRVVDAVPHGHWHSSTFVCGLSGHGLLAPMVLSGAMTGRAFLAYVEQCLVPVLPPASVVVLDNLACHKVAGVRQAIDAAGGAVLYLPPYSPDLNPIEQAFAKLKALLRQAGARSRDQLWRRLGALLDRFSSAECQRYIAHAGYIRS